MLLEYIQEALSRAKYEIVDDAEPYYGEIPELRGVWATGKTLEECRENLREVVEGWLLVRFRKGLPIPRIGGKQLEKVKALKLHA
ncbi:type II toxin-antitoxin system HicB family antitoxin [Acidobacteria bacterium AH-259-D05]|nr:type II toxin-antitoxin system HicB family antitoxin [Acidobacteria bacterium AH-259-D05]